MPRGLGVVQQKILTLLFFFLSLSLSRSPRQHLRIIKNIRKEWAAIENRALRRAIESLYASHLIEKKENRDGSISIVLTTEGKKKALTFKTEEMQIKSPFKWDKKWRVVLFDIPENNKKTRDIFRFRLKRLNFYEFQKSVFIHPFNCQEEIDFLVEIYNIKKFVRFILADSLDNELHLRKYFDV